MLMGPVALEQPALRGVLALVGVCRNCEYRELHSIVLDDHGYYFN